MAERNLEAELGLRVVLSAALFNDTSTSNCHRSSRRMLREAEIVFARDAATGRQFLLFGKRVLRKVVTKQPVDILKGVLIELEEKAEDIERVLALIALLKGRHDYELSD